jgi:hypothetical protein
MDLPSYLIGYAFANTRHEHHPLPLCLLILLGTVIVYLRNCWCLDDLTDIAESLACSGLEVGIRPIKGNIVPLSSVHALTVATFWHHSLINHTTAVFTTEPHIGSTVIVFCDRFLVEDAISSVISLTVAA